MSRTSRTILALDFGGTKHAAALKMTGEDRWLAVARSPAPPDADGPKDLACVAQLAERLLQGEKPDAIGVSFGGPIRAETGVVRLSHHVPGWENVPLKAWLEERFGAPTAADNDANVAAWGERQFGAGRGCDNLFYATVSTGVGGGWILNGKLWHGVDGMAGEIGHTTIDPAGPLCLCGKRGCVERLASGPYLALDARAALEKDRDRGAVLRRLAGGDLQNLTAQHLSVAAAEGDSLARSLLQRAGWAIGVGIGNAANFINPQLFVLGGGVTKAGNIFWQAARSAARETALPEVAFDIVPAALGDEAPLWGAAALGEAAIARARFDL